MGSEMNSSNAWGLAEGTVVSLITRHGVRYEGSVNLLNTQESTLGLEKAKCYGTEGRRKDVPGIPPSDKVYEYANFLGNDIMELRVTSSPPVRTEEQNRSNPPIIRDTQNAGGNASSSSPSTIEDPMETVHLKPPEE